MAESDQGRAVTHLGYSDSAQKVPAGLLRRGQTIWLSPGRAGVPRTIELVKPYPNDLDLSIIFEPTDDLPRSQLRVPRDHPFEVIA